MSSYKMTKEELLYIISKNLKKKIVESEIFSNEISVDNLKRIDKIFNKGLHYYLDPKPVEVLKNASIFFRKNEFKSELNISAKKIVHHFEDIKISISAISKLSDIKIDRELKAFSSHDNPKLVAETVRKDLNPIFKPDQKEFLKELISAFASKNIIVFEFVETWNKKEKVNIDRFFLHPNIIVLKRQQSAFRREILPWRMS